MGIIKVIAALAVAVFFLFAIVKGSFELPETQKRLNEAAFIDDGSLHPECDGQLVILSGTLTADRNACDDELGLTLPSPCAIRYVETLAVSRDEDGYECLVWKPLRRNDESDWLHERVLAGDLRIGAYRLGEELVDMLAPGRELSSSLLDRDELAALRTHEIYPVSSAGVFYLSEVPAYAFDHIDHTWECEGFRRVHYRVFDMKNELRYCIAGLADGDMLRRDESLDTRPIFEDARTKNDVVRQNGTFTILGMLLVALFCGGILYAVFLRR